MASPTFFPEGSTPEYVDTRWRILQKILGATVDGGGGGGGGGTQQVFFGASPPAAPTDPTKAALFYPTSGGAIKQWNGAAWV